MSDKDNDDSSKNSSFPPQALTPTKNSVKVSKFSILPQNGVQNEIAESIASLSLTDTLDNSDRPFPSCSFIKEESSIVESAVHKDSSANQDILTTGQQVTQHNPVISAFTEPEGFGIVQQWDHNPTVEERVKDVSGKVEKSENRAVENGLVGNNMQMEDFPSLHAAMTTKKLRHSKHEVAPQKQLKEDIPQKNQRTAETAKPQIKILQRKKVAVVDKFGLDFPQPENGSEINFFGCSKEEAIGFVSLSKRFPSFTNGQCLVSAIYTKHITKEKRNTLLKELTEDLEKKCKTMRDVVSQSSVPILAEEHIVTLEKMKPTFPDALYYCELCDYHLNSIGHVKVHFEEQSHYETKQIKNERDDFVNGIPSLLPNQCKAICKLLKNTLKLDHCSSYIVSSVKPPKNLREIAEEIETLILKRLLTIDEIKDKCPKLKLLGSVRYGVEHSDSDVNFSLTLEDLSAEQLYNAIKAIENNFLDKDNPLSNFDEISIIEGVHPRILMKYLSPKVPVTILWELKDKVKLGDLFYLYTKYTPKLAQLIKIIRYWARVCNLMPPHGLHKHGFDLMVIHYLQFRDILPVLDISSSLETVPEKQIDFNLGDEFVGFFGYYSRKLETVVQIEQKEPVLKRSTKWNNKIFQIKAPFRDDNVVTFSKPFQPYFLNCFLSTFVYFAIPRDRNGLPIIEVKLYSNITAEIKKRKQEKWEARRNGKVSSGNGDKADKEEEVAPVSEQKLSEIPEKINTDILNVDPKLVEHEMRWQQEGKLPNEDPYQFLTKRIDESLASSDKKKRPRTRKKNLTVAVQCPSTKPVEEFHEEEGESYTRAKIIEIREEQSKYIQEKFKKYKDSIKMVGIGYYSPSCSNINNCSEEQEIVSTNEMDEPYDKNAETSTNREEMDDQLTEIQYISQDDFRIRANIWPLDNIFSTMAGKWRKEDYGYKLEESVSKYFTNEYKPDIRCHHCDSNKHTTNDCPEMQIPDVVEINHERSEKEWKFLNGIIKSSYDINCLPKTDLDYALQTVHKMQSCLQEKYHDARLELFGSMRNGFGMTKSDVDICFRFKDDLPPEEANIETVINDIARILKKNFPISVQVIMNAKVPIVKFKIHKPNILEGDISYYNTLALTNTKMLCQYTTWDKERVPQLGVWIKKWAKSCSIGDASRGSLSSYSYIIMLIHYLQNCEPPVLPRLQEQFRQDEPPVLHGEWDIYYHNEIVHSWSTNTQTAAELFVGFLDYYSKFDYQNMVIQIRRQRPLTKIEKNWNRPICLEDPFDLKHNLGSGVTLRMFVHILKTIRKSREIFMNPIETDGYELLKSCSPGRPPLSRVCHYCTQVGHFKETCPRRLEQERVNRGEGIRGHRGGEDEYKGRDRRDVEYNRRRRKDDRGDGAENEQNTTRHKRNRNRGRHRNYTKPNEGGECGP